MKKLSVILLIFFFANISYAQQNSSDCQKRMDFLNKNVDLYAFSFVGQAKEIKILEKYPESEPSYEVTTTVKFDEKGKITETFFTNATIRIFGRTIYSYDDNNRIVKKTDYNPDGSAVSEDIYIYNSNGNLESSIKQNAIKKMSYRKKNINTNRQKVIHNFITENLLDA